MGIGFVLIVHLFFIGIVSCLIAAILLIISLIVSRKENRQRNIWSSIICPFVGLYTFYFCSLFGSGIVASIKNVDIGIGDAWYVPLSNNYQLLFIDVTDEAFIQNNDEIIISGVTEIQQAGNRIIGRTDLRYFTCNLNTNEIRNYTSVQDLKKQNPRLQVKLEEAFGFYLKKKNELAAVPLIVTGCISILLSIAAVYLSRKLIAVFVKVLSGTTQG